LNRVTARCWAEVNKTMKLIQHEQDRFYLDIEDTREQPPATPALEYRRLCGLSDEAST
jgi:hypothetical protein